MTNIVPIVMFAAVDPVARDFVASLARPGRNITGVVVSETGLADKRLDLLKEAIPRVTRIAVLVTAEDHVRDQAQEAQKAASSLGVTLWSSRSGMAITSGHSRRWPSIARVLFSCPRARFSTSTESGSSSWPPSTGCPRSTSGGEHVEDGGLMAYGSSISALSRRAASYVDRIFKGASPAELPVEQPTTYEFTINLRTAKALGLTIPPSILVRADQIID